MGAFGRYRERRERQRGAPERDAHGCSHVGPPRNPRQERPFAALRGPDDRPVDRRARRVHQWSLGGVDPAVDCQAAAAPRVGHLPDLDIGQLAERSLDATVGDDDAAGVAARYPRGVEKDRADGPEEDADRGHGAARAGECQAEGIRER